MADDGHIGGRFDDPGALLGYPEARRFRTLYFSSQQAGAYGETIGPRQIPIRQIAMLRQTAPRIPRGLQEVSDPESIESIYEGIVDPEDPTRGVVSTDWLRNRRLLTATLHPDMQIADLTAGATVQHLRTALAGIATQLGIDDIDYGAIVGRNRRFTQAVASYFFEQIDDERDAPAYDGLYFRSRYNPAWECWAIFDRSLVRVTAIRAHQIESSDTELAHAAALLHLAIESAEEDITRDGL